ncbi:hypothetical protein ZHAS_00014634 [Anopheles sinensis]|uniref:Ionotropic glutamate receptor C-terminal domain-containing protein n=1 Tax=Anopheles sinensis TaxID=74873 RepID=A0A084W8J7_ANOSI|nr:hypothetical protein ZHAS_00014634 [Anopheles sinensis]
MEDTSVDLFQRGIDRLCDPTYFAEVLVLTNDEMDFSGVDSLLKSRLGTFRPVSLRSYTLLSTPSEKACVVGFFNSMEIAQVAEVHFEMMALLIAVLPEDLVEPMSNFAEMMFSFAIHFFAYNRSTLIGSWLVDRGGVRYNSLEDFGPGGATGWDLRGQSLVFLKVDPNYNPTYEEEMGQTIAKRHNGTFISTINYMQSADFMFSPIYMGVKCTFVLLPEMFRMCYIVPRSRRKSIFAILIDPFDYISWGVLALTIVIVSCLLAALGETYRRYGIALTSLELLMMSINGPTHRYGGRFEVRIVGIFIMMNIVLVSCYQSLVISFMSAGRYEPELDTLVQINDTCQFFYDPQRDGILGYKFRHIFHTFEMLESEETRWTNKVCEMVSCFKKASSDGNDVGELFRYSKVQTGSTVMMNAIFLHSPMRALIQRYSFAFSESRLHYFPQLKIGKEIRGRNGHDTLHDLKVEPMSPSELLIVWIVFLIGCLAGGIIFLLEMIVAFLPKKVRILKRKRNNTQDLKM